MTSDPAKTLRAAAKHVRDGCFGLGGRGAEEALAGVLDAAADGWCPCDDRSVLVEGLARLARELNGEEAPDGD